MTLSGAQIGILGLVGNITRPSRTATLIEEITSALGHRFGLQTRTLEVIDVAPHFFAGDSLQGPQVAEAIQAVTSAEILVVGTPVYKASYTGALKHLLDLIRPDALAGKPVILAATGGSPLHGLVTEHQLRPLFGFFNALTLPTTIYALESDFTDYALSSAPVRGRIQRAVDEAAALLHSRFTAEPQLAEPLGAPA